MTNMKLTIEKVQKMRGRDITLEMIFSEGVDDVKELLSTLSPGVSKAVETLIIFAHVAGLAEGARLGKEAANSKTVGK